jgi:hypothetical protein
MVLVFQAKAGAEEEGCRLTNKKLTTHAVMTEVVHVSQETSKEKATIARCTACCQYQYILQTIGT